MDNVMVDLETMGTGPSAAIIAIGAVEFDPATSTTGGQFYEIVSLDSSVTGGGIIDPSTVMWWLNQSEEARKEITDSGAVHINVALLRFSKWLGERALRENLRLWGNGAGFDNVILETAYRRAYFPCPWDFSSNRCYRTVKALYPSVKAVRVGTHHNALDDAITQARHLLAIMAGAK